MKCQPFCMNKSIKYLDIDWGILAAVALSLLLSGSERRSSPAPMCPAWSPSTTTSLPSSELHFPGLLEVLTSEEALWLESGHWVEVEVGIRGAGPCVAPLSELSPHNRWSTVHVSLLAPLSDPDPSLPFSHFSAPSPGSLPGSRVPRLSEGESSDTGGDAEPWGFGTGFRSSDTSALFSRRPRQTVKGLWSPGWSLCSLLVPIFSRSCCSVWCRALILRCRCVRNTYCRWLTCTHTHIITL